QDQLQTAYTGGTVLHTFLGEEIRDTFLVKSLVKKITHNFHLPYFTLTPTFSICPSHGYLSGETPICPKCGEHTDVYSRVVGYLRPVSRWNDGKREEFGLRVTYRQGIGLEARVPPASKSHNTSPPEGEKRKIASGRTFKTIDLGLPTSA
ncbi:MAG: ribonucleoside triphosphate reductase, partial [Deltaproteobacteria bacterium]|nr:ribonucleoside triphosphate reductase [Deltaproteobacteria bacterium]